MATPRKHSPGDPTARTPPLRSTRETIDAFYSAYNDHDPNAAASLYGPEGRHREVAQERLIEGRGAIRDTLEHFLRCFPDATWAPAAVLVDGHRAAVAYVLTGTLQAPLGPFEPHEQQLRLEGLHLFHLSPLGIVETADYWDSGTFGRQMRT